VFVHEPEKSQQPPAEGLQASLAASTVRHAKVRSFIMAIVESVERTEAIVKAGKKTVAEH
jgi:hypothetical protein